jgi:hypothetical protein
MASKSTKRLLNFVGFISVAYVSFILGSIFGGGNFEASMAPADAVMIINNIEYVRGKEYNKSIQSLEMMVDGKVLVSSFYNNWYSVVFPYSGIDENTYQEILGVVKEYREKNPCVHPSPQVCKRVNEILGIEDNPPNQQRNTDYGADAPPPVR